MRSSLRGFVSVALLASPLLGCSSEVSQSDFSARLSRAVCDKAFQCLTPEALDNASSVYGRTRDECAATYAAASPFGCAPGQTLAESAVDKCLSDLGNQTCALVNSNGAVVPPYSCTSLCPALNDSEDGGVPDARPPLRRDAAVDEGAERGDASAADDAPSMDAPAADDAPTSDTLDASAD